MLQTAGIPGTTAAGPPARAEAAARSDSMILTLGACGWNRVAAEHDKPPAGRNQRSASAKSST